MMIAREARLRANPQPKPQPPGKIDPADRPPLAPEMPREADPTIEWLAHIAAGRIEVK
jgi:hypothetical protein